MVIITKAGRTSIIITYQGKNISRDIAPFLLSFSFTDNSSGKADDLSLSLEDRQGLWLNDWTPSKGDVINCSIISENDSGKTSSLPCGSFSVDQIDYSFPPGVLSIKAVSSSITKKASQELHTRSWENISLAQVCSDIASKNNLALFMKGGEGITFERVDQIRESDLSFIKDLCEDSGLNVKIQNSRLVIYEAEEYEDANPITSLSVDDDRLISCKFSSKSVKVKKKARVKYHDPYKDETFEAEFDDDSIEGSERELVIHERVESQAHAERLAKQRVTDSNRQEVTGSITLKGDTRFAAGLAVNLEGFGLFSGKHFISKCTHKIDSSGYTVSLDLGMPKAEKKKAKARKSKKAGKKAKSSAAPALYYTGDRYYREA